MFPYLHMCDLCFDFAYLEHKEELTFIRVLSKLKHEDKSASHCDYDRLAIGQILGTYKVDRQEVMITSKQLT